LEHFIELMWMLSHQATAAGRVITSPCVAKWEGNVLSVYKSCQFTQCFESISLTLLRIKCFWQHLVLLSFC